MGYVVRQRHAQGELDHHLDCDVDTFWKTFLSEDYNRKFYLDKLGFRAFEVLSQTDTERRLRVVPKLNMPGPVMKILGDSFGYEEEGRLDKDNNVWRWKLIPNTMRDKLRTEGTVTIEAAGEGKCRRIDEVTMEAESLRHRKAHRKLHREGSARGMGRRGGVHQAVPRRLIGELASHRALWL